jgi:hypothetical protein
MPLLTVDLDAPDALTGAACPLRVTAHLTTAPPLDAATLAPPLVAALEAAIAHAQRRYHLYRDEVPSRAAAVEDAARGPLAEALARAGARLEGFEVRAVGLRER